MRYQDLDADGLDHHVNYVTNVTSVDKRTPQTNLMQLTFWIAEEFVPLCCWLLI